jgi:hypothetical protein
MRCTKKAPVRNQTEEGELQTKGEAGGVVHTGRCAD